MAGQTQALAGRGGAASCLQGPSYKPSTADLEGSCSFAETAEAREGAAPGSVHGAELRAMGKTCTLVRTAVGEGCSVLLLQPARGMLSVHMATTAAARLHL